MSISISASTNSLGYTASDHTATEHGGNDTLTLTPRTGPSPRWKDKDNNGKIDVEVDFNAGAGEWFKAKGLKGYKNYTPEQVQETLHRMNEIQVGTNLAFHEKGKIDNPDGKLTFGRYVPQVGSGDELYVGASKNEGAPVEVYLRAGDKKDGLALTRALLQSLGVRDPNPDKYSKVPASALDSQGYSALSRQLETITGHNYNGQKAVLPRINDMEELLGAYGRNSEYEEGYHEITTNLSLLGRAGAPITWTLTSENVDEVMDAKDDTHDQELNLNPGTFSSVGGFKKNVALSSRTNVEDVLTGSGTNTVIASSVANKITLGSGANKVVYNNVSDSSLSSRDVIFGFKTGTDKIDVSKLCTSPPYLRFDVYKYEDGETWVRGWAGVNNGLPDFLLRADGAQKSDLIQM
jgi:hypothetical protein